MDTVKLGASLTPMVIVCYASNFCGSTASQLGRIINVFPPFPSDTTSLGTIIDSHQGRGYQDRASLNPQNVNFKVHGFFSNTDFQLLAEKQCL